MSSDEGYIQVDPEELMEVARKGLGLVSELDGYFEDVKRWLSIIDTFWGGAASDAYQERLAQIMPVLETNKDVVCRYPERLKGYAEAYGHADRQAELIAKSVEAAQWAEV